MTTVFFSYCHADEALRDQLERQLRILQRQGLIETWHDRRIEAGQDFAGEIDAHIEADEIILLLVSPDFLNSDYCYEIEMTRALERCQRRSKNRPRGGVKPGQWRGAKRHGARAHQIAGACHGALARRANSVTDDQVPASFRARLWASL